LLRADLHTLFDLDLIGIEPKTRTVAIHARLMATEYARFSGQRVRGTAECPSSAVLEWRWFRFQAATLVS
jgi:hypothetical protein